MQAEHPRTENQRKWVDRRELAKKEAECAALKRRIAELENTNALLTTANTVLHKQGIEQTETIALLERRIAELQERWPGG